MPNDKCPKCGANRKRGEEFPEFDCGTYLYPTGELWYQHELCETRCELASLRTRHQRLVEAAKEAANIHSEDLIEGYDAKAIYDLRDALESEANNG